MKPFRFNKSTIIGEGYVNKCDFSWALRPTTMSRIPQGGHLLFHLDTDRLDRLNNGPDQIFERNCHLWIFTLILVSAARIASPLCEACRIVEGMRKLGAASYGCTLYS